MKNVPNAGALFAVSLDKIRDGGDFVRRGDDGGLQGFGRLGLADGPHVVGDDILRLVRELPGELTGDFHGIDGVLSAALPGGVVFFIAPENAEIVAQGALHDGGDIGLDFQLFEQWNLGWILVQKK